ncbi:BMP family ABC transporter substrate-binding protein [Chloroflexus sp. MS-CIW-1]|jgi:simple sugar transport system substrate-binding protein|uniref:BMP family lipoprotein n=1 Tax=unclassified Chloroflexus TaxID=2633855 RepID=UPI0004DF28EC|nr:MULTISPECIES: BMP family ABC transporter substrate-binding protein [unclassified Chloroflexus]MBO9346750.1 BMP family ABC transporter substrate-binding protein [Chloroflexus sp.]MDN5272799.1 BMP family ABC transporter substrate-binding protein [Chloroflexus sp. MS-CIW-1]
MNVRLARWSLLVLTLLSLVLAACGSQPTTGSTPVPTAVSTEPTTPSAGEEFIFGMVLVGPINDGGWNQAHYEAAQYVVEKVPGVKFIYIDKVNPADRPNVKVEQAIEELIGQGARLIITNSAEFADGTNVAAAAHPEVAFIHASGDKVLTGEAPPNVRNLMGRMEYGKMIAGCAAALTTEAGRLAYLGPLIDPETRRLVNSSYLGARYCWETYRGRPAEELAFKVTWIGFWFNIPGVTLDPTKVANDFINEGYDVILSGIDTTEALVEANKAAQAGKRVFAIPYDFKGACAQGEAVCLGVPYFNWGPDYKRLVELARAGKWEPAWEWTGPNWSNLNDPDTSMIGFVKGPALSAENAAKLDEFIAKLADGSLNLFTGPLYYQDGSVFVPEGQVADDKTIWYTSQLLAGIEGQSAP